MDGRGDAYNCRYRDQTGWHSSRAHSGYARHSVRRAKNLAAGSFYLCARMDENGHPGPRVRLIYPELGPGETGRATFRIHSPPATIVLQGEWKGPWQDPY
jgi:hypothetical protein